MQIHFLAIAQWRWCGYAAPSLILDAFALNDMTILGDALLEVTQAYLINYEILGNTERALHAHIFPRYMSELENCRKFPVFVSYSREQRNSRPFDYQRDKTLMKRIETAIRNRS